MGELRPEDIAPWAHDLRNAVQAMHFASGHLDARLAAKRGVVREALADIMHATVQMRALLDGLIATCEGEVDPVQWTRVPVAMLVQRAERRLRFELEGKEPRPYVSRGKELPETVASDPIRLQRVIDNLVLNAATHTRSGTVRLHAGGDAGTFRFRVSNTGPSLDAARIEALVLAPPLRRGLSHGWGLGIVISMLSRVGATLEIDARRGHPPSFEVEHPTALSGPQPPASSLEEAFRRVVRFRRSRRA